MKAIRGNALPRALNDRINACVSMDDCTRKELLHTYMCLLLREWQEKHGISRFNVRNVIGLIRLINEDETRDG